MKSLTFIIYIACLTLLSAQAKDELLTLPSDPSIAIESDAHSKKPTNSVFGANLFTPSRKPLISQTYNPEYVIQNGDQISLQIWGALNFNSILTVDAQGHIFIPEVGPIKVAGTKNSRLTEILSSGISETYTQHIKLYANLESSQRVKVFVSGYVAKPGLYEGYASGNLISFLQLAGGIDNGRGSYIEIQIKRGQETRKTVNLYDFLTKGELAPIQFSDGDVIFVNPIQDTLNVEGLAQNAYQFEFADTLSGEELLRLARPEDTATILSVQRITDDEVTATTLKINQISAYTFLPGDELNFTSDSKKSSIFVNIQGEYDGAGIIPVKYGTTLGELFDSLELNEYSNAEHIQLFNERSKEHQKRAIMTSLKRLESSVLSARSNTAEEATIRLDEAELLLRFIERAKATEPLGQVILNGSNWREIRLEDNDRIVIPGDSQLVGVYGEVNFPRTQVYDSKDSLGDYLRRSGGLSQHADEKRIIILRPNGEITSASKNLFGFSHSKIQPGDEIFVIPKINKKYFPMMRDISQIIYNTAIATKVVLDI